MSQAGAWSSQRPNDKSWRRLCRDKRARWAGSASLYALVHKKCVSAGWTNSHSQRVQFINRHEIIFVSRWLNQLHQANAPQSLAPAFFNESMCMYQVMHLASVCACCIAFVTRNKAAWRPLDMIECRHQIAWYVSQDFPVARVPRE